MVLLLVFLAPQADAQDNAQLPYEMAYGYLAFFETLAPLDLVVPSMMIRSTNPSVKPQDITFKLVEDGEWLSFQPDERGVFVVPKNEEWLNDKLMLISNQPKGTLQLEIAFNARALNADRMPYQDLMQFAEQFGQALGALAELSGSERPDIEGLTVLMSTGGSATILSSKRQRQLKANSAGMVVMKTDPKLMRENPEVVFSEIPLGIMPLQ